MTHDTTIDACICDTGPNSDGPAEDCPQHGRTYAYWVAAAGEAEAALERVEVVLTEWDQLSKAESGTTARIRAAIRGGVTR